MNELSKDAPSWLTVGDDSDGQRIDNFLSRTLKGVPKSHIYRILRSGEVRVNKGRVGPDVRLASGDVVRVPPIRVAARSSSTSQGVFRVRGEVPIGARIPGAPQPAKRPFKLRVLHEDSVLIAIDKPAGLAVHGGSGIALGLIERLRAARPEEPFLELVHRLDRETSGVLLVAKRRSALTSLHAQLREGRVDKRYLVLARGPWAERQRTISVPLHKFSTREGERRVRVEASGREATTVFRLREAWNDHVPPVALLEAELKTGRTHQIRVHLAHLGHPLAGDDKYGDFTWNRELSREGLKRMFLHAWRVAFIHPRTGEPMRVEAAMAEELQAFLRGI
jgi:23S rRNA pseudouridine955/2504/2580 synthase